MSTKRDAFVRLATKRTNAVIERLRILGNCSNPYAYEYEEDDIRRIFAAIEREVKTARSRFRARSSRQFVLRDKEGVASE